MSTNEKKKSGSKAGLIGASLVGLATAAYFFFGPKGKKNQKAAKAWTLKMKAEVIEELEKAKVMSEPIYHQIIDKVAAKYKKELKASPKEVQSLVKDLKDHWKIMNRSVNTLKPVVKREISKITKKPAVTVKTTKTTKTVKPKAKKK